ncbi:MAG: type II toxin-antitoxin system prevent-host-death family antitoxin [Deltaproteobacteria bacterium]|nr:type II toxin-antitoxin system prevent-host-death family antitoxin [Deltaproteobacteria bacterium]MBW1961700.1 type II toxin-antitoxin system prevent-host-death family antitoxin [Deltaproteobacteria bacterium]MBW1993463.1 type II toxin-antitoxin system prevent-host-death family antitoxin [Deltaproteobacteria bacterium]MBW2151018.1 type II toxin-antitoxin system prevent-host-death family antitoxin [Deltaproteobacteria bacterium]
MIRANISDVKNRLSYYLKLVQGGEQVEIMNRNTPMARIVHVSQAENQKEQTAWVQELQQLGIVTAPKKQGFPPELLSGKKRLAIKGKKETGVLRALLKERRNGR